MSCDEMYKITKNFLVMSDLMNYTGEQQLFVRDNRIAFTTQGLSCMTIE